MGRYDEQQRERGYARERRLDDTKPERARPRLGGASPLPADGSTADLFSVALEDLTIEERAAAGWCLRFGVDAVPTDGTYDVRELFAEITITVGGTALALEVDVFPGCTVHLVGDQIAARLKWGITPANVPAGVSLRWQLSRGLCVTNATRGYPVQAGPAVGVVPPFASGFALFSQAADIAEDLQLEFSAYTNGPVVQHYTRNDLLQAVGAFASLPPGATVWRWLTSTYYPARLVFAVGSEP